MPTELCKKCGDDLQEHSFCLLCNKTIRWYCSSCNWKSAQQIHFECWHKKSINILEDNYECTILLPEFLILEIKKILIILSMQRNHEFELSDIVSLIIKYGIGDSRLKYDDVVFLNTYFSDKKHILESLLDRVLLTAEFFKNR